FFWPTLPFSKKCRAGPRTNSLHPLATFRKWSKLPRLEQNEGRQIMIKPTLRVVPPRTKIRKVTPRRPKNGDVRTREYLTEREVEQLIEGCKDTRRPHRDQTMIRGGGRTELKVQ